MEKAFVVKSVVFYFKDHARDQLPDELIWLVKEFRLMVNETVRAPGSRPV